MSVERPLGWIHVASVVVGAIIGVGIFFTPATLARSLPTPSWVLGIWVLGGVISVASALVYAELGGRFPRAGGVYAFLREGFGPTAGPLLAFGYGWIQLLVVQPGSMAAIAIVLVNHIAYFTGALPPALHKASAMLAIATFTGANLLGLRTGGRIQIGFAAMKIGALGVLVGIGVRFGGTERLVSSSTEAVSGSWLSWMLIGLIPVFWSFGGAYHGTFIAGSVRDPQRAVPRGIMAGIAVVLVLYLAVNVAYLSLLGHAGLAASESPAAEATALALGPTSGKVLAAVIVLSAAGILNTVCLGFPFVIYAMAKDGLFFQRAGRLDERTGRPSLAVALQGTMACLAVLASGKIDALLVGITFADVTFQALVAVALLIAQRGPAPEGVIRAPVLAVVTVLLVQMGVGIGVLVEKPKESAYGAVILALGVAIFGLWRRQGSARSGAP